MLALGTPAPSFTLLDTVTNKKYSLAELQSDCATVIMFICNHCPYVKHIAVQLAAVAKHYQSKGVSFVAISSNDIDNYPEDAPQLMQCTAEKIGYTFPYLYDETQEVATAYNATCTPDFYIFDKNMQLVYRGRFDASSPGNNEAVTGKDLTCALDAILDGTQPSTEQMPSMGCNIKWKSKQYA